MNDHRITVKPEAFTKNNLNKKNLAASQKYFNFAAVLKTILFMKKTIILPAAVFACCILLSSYSFSQGTAINTSGAAPDSSAILDVNSQSQGVLLPRLTEAQRNLISAPANGLLIYQTDGLAGFYYNAGSGIANWMYLGSDNLGNHTASDSLNMSMNKIVNLATCTNNYDAANKLYVDNSVAAGGGGGGHYPGESYQGGKVFWVDGAGLSGLIAYPSDFRGVYYSNVSSTLIGDSAQDNNDGQINSRNIINQPGHTKSAAYSCDTLNSGGYSDWYLPSHWELYTLFENQQYVGGFRANDIYYISSTEYSASNAMAIYFYKTKNSITVSTLSKNADYSWTRFRCIRKF